MAWADSIAGVINDLLMLPNKDDINFGYFRANVALDKIMENGDLGGGDSVKLPILVTASAATVGEDPYQSVATSAEDTFRSLTSDYKYVYASDAISEIDIERASNKQAANILNMKLNVLKGKMKKAINTGFWTGTGAAGQVVGLPSIWTGATYGGLTRTSWTDVLASNTAYVPATSWPKFGGAASEPAAYQTYWDATGAAISGASAAETAVALLSEAYVRCGDTGDEPDFVAVGKGVWGQIMEYLNGRGSSTQYGMTKSVTASDGETIKLFGAQIIYDSAIPSDSAFVINTKYLHFASLEGGFGPQNLKVMVKDLPTMYRVKSLQAMVATTMLCSNSTRLAWIDNIPSA